MAKPQSEFHRPLPADNLPMAGRPFGIEAGPDERAALARRFGIVTINRLRAEGVVRPEANGRRVRLDGRLSAEVVQTCVVTLEPVTVVIDIALERLYGYDVAPDSEERAGEVFLDLADDLPAEPLTDGVLDIGAAAAEQLALELDPYPRKPGAVFDGVPSGFRSVQEEGPAGPLARLAAANGRGWVVVASN
jgi:Large ribosomal RNA subunit accumulation protein YceD